MSKRRVHELAKDLGLEKQELVTKINGLGLGISVNNYMTVLSPTEVDSIKSALKKEGAAKKKVEATAAKTDDAVAPAVVRRRSKSSSDGEADEAKGDAAPAAAPIRRRRKVAVVTDDETGEEVEAVQEIETVAPTVRRRKTISAEDEQVAEAEPTAEEEEAAEAAPAAEEEAAAEVEAPEEAAPAAEQEQEEAAEEEPAAAAEEEASEEEQAAEAEPTAEEEGAEAEEAADEEPAAAAEAAPTPEASAPKAAPAEAAKPAAARKKEGGGAQVVGAISQSVLMERLKAEGKDFSPGPKRGSRRSSSAGRNRRTKRVVEGRDLYDGRSRRSKRRTNKSSRPQKTEITTAAEHKRVVRIEDAITVGDMAREMGVKAGQVAMKLVEMGMMANVNTMLDYETAAIVAEEFEHTVENVAFDISQFYDTTPDAEELQEPRPPVVTVMGHVDHGKTSLLDAMRETAVTSTEAGGITQHIGAYQVTVNDKKITFLDTPGHEAFTALRARGAKATDIVVLVVAADDGVMPQTVEAINHAKDADVPIIVAVNKVDKPSANPDRVKQALSEYELIPEEWGGKNLFVEVSALQRTNIEGLIEAIILQSELEELKANPERDAQGLIIEAELDIGRGPVASVLVQRGTLRQGDILVSGQYYGRVRAMTNEHGKQVVAAGPSTPVEITGISGVPPAGEPFFVVAEERDAKRITQNVQDQRRKETMATRAKESATSLEDLSAMIKEGEIKSLKVILKGDVQGSLEAIREAFGKAGNEEVAVKVIHSAVGGITENDVNLAASSEKGAVIVGFNVRPDSRAADMAEKYGVQILTHNVIYDAIEQIRSILEGMLAPIVEENVLGRAEVREIFSAPKIGTIAGCYVQDGILRRNARARLLRDGRVVYETSIGSLRRFKDDVKEVKTGFECGLSLDNYNDIKIGDIVEAYDFKEVAATLD